MDPDDYQKKVSFSLFTNWLIKLNLIDEAACYQNEHLKCKKIHYQYYIGKVSQNGF